MTVYELHLRLMDAVDKINSASSPEIPIEQRDRYLNEGIERFIKQRYGGVNSKQTSFEQTQKRTDDLSNLITYAKIASNNIPGQYTNKYVGTELFALPSDYWFSIVEQITLSAEPCPKYQIKVNCGKVENILRENEEITVNLQPKTHDQINVFLSDPFKRPDRDMCYRVTIDGNYIEGKDSTGNNYAQIFFPIDTKPLLYHLGYLRKYKPLQVNKTYQTKDKTKPDYWMNLEFWFNNHTHQEIVDLAALCILEAIEQPRQQSFPNQVITQE